MTRRSRLSAITSIYRRSGAARICLAGFGGGYDG
jgi:hypothetical protein